MELEPGFGMDKLRYEIFSILESKFLFGEDSPKDSYACYTPATPLPRTTNIHASSGRVSILSIDGGDSLLAAATLVRLESLLQKQSGDQSARIADYFDVAAGSGIGGVLAAMLFSKGPHGLPLFTAKKALEYLTDNHRRLFPARGKGLFKGFFRPSAGGRFLRIFADSTLKDTIKPLLIPCFDLSTAAPFLFSRADAVEADGFNFMMRDVCTATCGRRSSTVVKSLDGRTRINAVGGALTMQNPTAAAITHVLNNKQEFPFADSLEDLLVVSFGGLVAAPSKADLVHIASQGAADMVDQAVAMAFGENSTNNYVRIQGSGFGSRIVDEVSTERNVESIMFRGKRVSKETNIEKMERFSSELVKEAERRRQSLTPSVTIKQAMSPRISSATTSTVRTSTISYTTSSSP